MGMSSFLTTDTKESIWNKYADGGTLVEMVDDKGNRILCINDGYCRFNYRSDDGQKLLFKDIHILVYEMTTGEIIPNKAKDYEKYRNLGIRFTHNPYAVTFELSTNKKVNWYNQEEFKDNPDYVSKEKAREIGEQLYNCVNQDLLHKNLEKQGITVKEVQLVIHPNLNKERGLAWKPTFLKSCPSQGHRWNIQ